jgi:hypothetical protein
MSPENLYGNRRMCSPLSKSEIIQQHEDEFKASNLRYADDFPTRVKYPDDFKTSTLKYTDELNASPLMSESPLMS